MNTLSRTPSAQLWHETHPLTDADIASFRAHEGEIDDEHDAARDYEAEGGRMQPGDGWLLALLYLGGVAVVVSCAALVAALWPH